MNVVGGRGTLEDNDIVDNGSAAVHLHKNGGGSFEGNDLTGNRHGPWLVDGESTEDVDRVGNKEE